MSESLEKIKEKKKQWEERVLATYPKKI